MSDNAYTQVTYTSSSYCTCSSLNVRCTHSAHSSDSSYFIAQSLKQQYSRAYDKLTDLNTTQSSPDSHHHLKLKLQLLSKLQSITHLALAQRGQRLCEHALCL
jgi:hypothetical protein